MFKRKLDNNTNNYIDQLSYLFDFRNCLIYIICFLVSMISLKNGFRPFGLAIVAACVSGEIPIVIPYISVIIGNSISGGLEAFTTFLFVSILYFILVLILKRKVAMEDRNEETKTGSKLFWAGVVYSFVKLEFSGFSLYNFVIAIILYGITYVFYKIFVNGLEYLKNIGIVRIYTSEEITATAILCTICFSIFKDVFIGAFSLYYLIICFMAIFIGWNYGIRTGVVSSLFTGLMSMLIVPFTVAQLLIIVVGSLIAAILSRLNKFSVLGFLILSAIITFGVQRNAEIDVLIKELYVASIGMLFLPIRRKIDLDEIFGKIKLLSTSDRRLKEKVEAKDTRKEIDTMITNFTKARSRDDMVKFESFVQDFFDNLESIDQNIFYEEISNEYNDIARDICKVLVLNNMITDTDLVNILNSHNNFVIMRDQRIRDDLQEIVKISNKTIKTYRENEAKIQIEIEKEIKKEKNNKETNEDSITGKKYILQVDSAKALGEGRDEFEDCILQTKLQDDKYLVALSSSIKRTQFSKKINKLNLRLLKNLTRLGFNKEKTSLEIQSQLNAIDEKYNALDFVILDLLNEEIFIAKNNSCDSYIKLGKNIKKVSYRKGNKDTENSLFTSTFKLKDQEIYVICNNGVAFSSSKTEDWIKEALKEVDVTDVKEMANYILNIAKENNRNHQEDLIVIVCKVLKNN